MRHRVPCRSSSARAVEDAPVYPAIVAIATEVTCVDVITINDGGALFDQAADEIETNVLIPAAGLIEVGVGDKRQRKQRGLRALQQAEYPHAQTLVRVARLAESQAG